MNSAMVNNNYDFSNILPTTEYVTYLVQYMVGIYEEFNRLMIADEEKNKPFKLEYKEWSYKKSYGNGINIRIKKETFTNVECKSYDEFQRAVAGGTLDNVKGLTIELDINFERGHYGKLDEYKNVFSVSFEPSDITFKRESNNSDVTMNQIEENIKNILGKFPSMNTIFCTKG